MPIVSLSELFEPIGRVTKVHGVAGEIVVVCDNMDVEKYIFEQAVVVINGLPVPFYIEEYDERGDNCIAFKLGDIDSRESAQKLIGLAVWLQPTKKNKGKTKLTEPSIIGYKVLFNNKEIGVLKEYIDYPENPLLGILFKGKEILIPAHEDFIQLIDDKKKEITICPPEGLIEMYLE